MMLATRPRSVTFVRRLAPVKETRVAPRPAIPFGCGLEQAGPSCPIDQRALPTIEGVGLEPHELSRVTRCRNRAMAQYRVDCGPSDLDLVEHVGRQAASDELRRTLRERPHARPLVVKAKRDARDEAFWAAYTEVLPRRVRIGQSYNPWDREWDLADREANSGLVGHEA